MLDRCLWSACEYRRCETPAPLSDSEQYGILIHIQMSVYSDRNHRSRLQGAKRKTRQKDENVKREWEKSCTTQFDRAHIKRNKTMRDVERRVSASDKEKKFTFNSFLLAHATPRRLREYFLQFTYIEQHKRPAVKLIRTWLEVFLAVHLVWAADKTDSV